MRTFEEAVGQDTPRLVVMYRREGGGDEQFQWGIVGQIPPLSLLGAIGQVQAELPLTEPGDDRRACPQPALVIAWDAEVRAFEWYAGADVPADAMCGMLEIIKSLIVDSRRAQRVGAARVQLLGPDGQPMRGQ